MPSRAGGLELPRMDGRTVVVTGGNCGLGYFAAEQLAGLGATVVIAARDADRAASALRSVRDSLPRPEDQQSDLMKYARSKLAVMSLGFELARRFAADGSHASSVVAHPGTAIDSLSPARAVAANQPDVSRALRPVLRALAHGKHAGASSLVAAVASPAAHNGDYWGPQGWRQRRGPRATRPPRQRPRPLGPHALCPCPTG